MYFVSCKIWLKDAVQCRACGMSCHKKCINKCLIGSSCVGSLSQGSSVNKTNAGSSVSSGKVHRHSLGDADMTGAFLEHRGSASGPVPNFSDGDTLSVTLPKDQPRRASIQPEIVMTSAENVASPPSQVR